MWARLPDRGDRPLQDYGRRLCHPRLRGTHSSADRRVLTSATQAAWAPAVLAAWVGRCCGAAALALARHWHWHWHGSAALARHGTGPALHAHGPSGSKRRSPAARRADRIDQSFQRTLAGSFQKLPPTHGSLAGSFQPLAPAVTVSLTGVPCRGRPPRSASACTARTAARHCKRCRGAARVQAWGWTEALNPKPGLLAA
jgi:hypothetical protein